MSLRRVFAQIRPNADSRGENPLNKKKGAESVEE